MNVLIVHAHHEPKSFSSSLASGAADQLSSAGHNVTTSDLHAMQFNPVSDRRNFTTASDPNYLKQQAEERYASEHNGFAADVEAEVQKLEAADALLFSFPLWWFGMPAILKGWADRVLAAGRVYGGPKLYEGGIGGGTKRAMVLMTTGGGPVMYGGRGMNPSLDHILTPIHHGIFWFNGFRPLDPFVAWSPAHLSNQQRQDYLKQLDQRMENLFSEVPTSLPPLADFPDYGMDTHERFHVTVRITKPIDDQFKRLVSEEQGMIETWRRDGRLIDFSRSEMNDEHPRVFLTLRARSLQDVSRWLDELPLAAYFEFEITQLHKPEIA